MSRSASIARSACRRRDGGALILVLALAVLLSLLGAALMNGATAGRSETNARHHSLQAFWAAEAGAGTARRRIMVDQSYRNAPAPMSWTNGSVSYGVNVIRSGDIFTVLATGASARASRRISQKLRVAYGTIPTNYAIFVDHADVDMRQFTIVDGSIFSWGNVLFWQDADITGTAFGSNYASNPDVMDPAIIQPPPEFPPLEPTYYEQKIAYALDHDSGLNLGVDVNLAGNTCYVSGDWYHTRVTRVTSTPPGGTLVVSGDVTLNKDGITIGPNVNLICGGRFTLMKSVVVNTNCNIYAKGNVSVMQSGTVFSQSSLVTPASIDCQHTIRFSGLLYAGGQCNLYQDTVVSGLIYAKNGMFMDQRSRVNWAPSLLPAGWPRGVVTNVTMTVLPSDWAEL